MKLWEDTEEIKTDAKKTNSKVYDFEANNLSIRKGETPSPPQKTASLIGKLDPFHENSPDNIQAIDNRRTQE